MMENGIFTKHKGMNVEVILVKEESCTLRSTDKESLKLGFQIYKPGIYLKPIKKNKLGKCYRLRHYATYKGHTGMFSDLGNGIISMYINDLELAKQHEYKVIDRNQYAIKVNIEDVEITVEKTPISIDDL